MDRSTIKSKNPKLLLEWAEELGIPEASSMRRQEMVFAVCKCLAEQSEQITANGVLSLAQDGFGFLRSGDSGFLPAADDIYISVQQAKKYGLRTGDSVSGCLVPPAEGQRYFSLTDVAAVNSLAPNASKNRVRFDSLTALYPKKKILLEPEVPDVKDLTLRVIELVAPLGFGQRALIVAPPRTGKTVMMQSIAQALTANHPKAHLIFLMVGERPEEVTDVAQSVKAEVIGSTFDESPTRHVQVAEMVLARAKSLAESGQDVIILLDSITRLARAYNAVVPSSGKVLTGGVDANALQPAKQFFGAARAFESGSLTIIGTALVDTGSRMDDVIFEEFKGTGNAEIVLDRRLADKRQFPAIDPIKSGTRREDKLIDPDVLSKMWIVRRLLAQMNTVEAMEFLLEKLRQTKDNEDFFRSMTAPK